MKIKKSTVSLLLTAALCMGQATPAALCYGETGPGSGQNAVMNTLQENLVADASSTLRRFRDASEIEHKEAVSTMVELGVINGMGDGSYFAPLESITRAAVAKMICVMLNGGAVPELSEGDTGFTDVPASHWAAAYIKYCVDEGIVTGRGDGTFGPEDPVTGSALSKMALVALGYRVEKEKLTGEKWEANTVALGNTANLYNGISWLDQTQVINRDGAAQVLYNTLHSFMVSYDGTRRYFKKDSSNKNITFLKEKFGRD